MTTYCFIRHGEIDTTEAGKGIYHNQGYDMVTLSPRGISQIEHTSKDDRLNGAELTISSPFGRTMHTAAILSKELQLDICVETRLHEWRADRTLRWISDFSESDASYREMNSFRGIPSPEQKYNWETADDIRRRVCPVLEKYSEYRKVIVVTHGTLMQYFLGIDHPDNGEICLFQYDDSVR